ncbi:MAG TPA: cytochrome P450 [Streptosporangiaceae bacterium]|nr:cytochrome P450 [Streptosporangiaceae bacterium]
MTHAPAIDLTDPALFARNDFWPVLAWLRANDPVHWHEQADGSGFWVISRYHDIVAVYLDPGSFSSRYGMRLGSSADAVSAVSQRMMIVSDPPEHTQLKRVLARAFAPAEVPEMDRLARQTARDVVADAVRAGEVDVVEVAKALPNHVICAMMGLPRSDWAWIGQTMTEAFEGPDEQSRSGAHGEIFLYFDELLRERRGGDGDDFISRVARDHRANDVPGAGSLLTDEEIIVNLNGVLAGANETTRYSAAGGVLALAENRGQWRELRAAGDAAIPAAGEEVLRWTVPDVHAMRTATRDAIIGGQRIGAGDRVTLWNVSANRDESVFTEAERFLVTRSPNRHLTFGAGHHLCIGARLARLELSAFLHELVRQVETIELIGEPRYNASNFTWGLIHLPVRLVPKRDRV